MLIRAQWWIFERNTMILKRKSLLFVRIVKNDNFGFSKFEINSPVDNGGVGGMSRIPKIYNFLSRLFQKL